MNPCPCGYYGDEKHECTCSMGMVQRYQYVADAVSSGPLLDRMALCARCASDIHLDVRSVPYQKLSSLDSGKPSAIRNATLLRRVEGALTVQKKRFAALGKSSVLVNGDMDGPPAGGFVRGEEVLYPGTTPELEFR